MNKHWVKQAIALFGSSREPVPHEINELDWKIALSANKERLIEHLIAFANHASGGYLIYGVADQDAKLVGIDQAQVQATITQLTNLGRDAIDPPLVLDHVVVEIEGVPLLFVHIPEQANKPAHRRGKGIEEAWIRSGGSTRKASRTEIGSLMLHSQAIEIFDDRITFTNPGRLLPSKRVDRLIGTTSESRNELLASKFRLYRICEERGTGFQKIVAAVELFGLPPVLFTITNLICDAVDAGRITRKDSTSGNKFAEYIPYWA